MELPFTLVFEPPSQSELRAFWRSRRALVAGGLLVLAIGSSAALLSVGHAASPDDGRRAPLSINATPAGAVVRIDNQIVGVAPASSDVAAGVHHVAFESAGALGGDYALTTDGVSEAVFSPTLWRRQPLVQRIRAVLPGAALSDVRVLADGDLALTVSAGRDPVLQAWRLAPRSGTVTELVTAWPGDRLAVSSDATRVALIGREIGPPSIVEQEKPGGARRLVWLGPTGESTLSRAWRAPIDGEEIVTDASWNPAADDVLIATTRHTDGATGATSRVWLLDPRSLDARLVLSLPSRLVTGTAVWSPTGERVAFVARGGTLNALCVLDVRNGQFRYLADLAPSATTPLAYPVGVWSRDGDQFMFVAPSQTRPSDDLVWPPPSPRRGVFVARALDRDPELIAETDAGFPAWREDGQLMGIAQQAGTGLLRVGLIAPSQPQQQLADIPFRPTGPLAVMWDVPHAQILLAEQAGPTVEVSLVRLGLEAVQ